MSRELIDAIYQEFDTTLSKWPHIDQVKAKIEHVLASLPAVEKTVDTDAVELATTVSALQNDLAAAKTEFETLVNDLTKTLSDFLGETVTPEDILPALNHVIEEAKAHVADNEAANAEIVSDPEKTSEHDGEDHG